MKKLSIVLAVALAFAVAVPVLAAPTISVGGSLETKFTAEKSGVTNENWFNLNLGLNAGDKIKATVILSPWDNPATPALSVFPNLPAAAGNSYDGTSLKDLFGAIGTKYTVDGAAFNPDQADTSITVPALKIKKAVLETDGSLWNGGPSVRTTAGDIAVNQGSIVGDLGNRKGIQVTGMKVGPLGMEAFYAVPGGYARVMNFDDENKYGQLAIPNNDEVVGGKLTASVAGVELGANVVRSDEEKAEYAITGKMSPMENVTVDGYFAADRTEKDAYRINGSMNVMPNLRIFGGYRDTEAGFAPMYVSHVDIDKNGTLEADEWLNASRYVETSKGFNAGVETTQAGVHMVGTYDDPSETAKLAADTTLAGFKLDGSVKAVAQEFNKAEVNASRDFQMGSMKVTGSYGLAVNAAKEAEHEFKAATTLDMIPQLKGIALDGRVLIAPDQDNNEYEANAKYAAPNGLNLGVQYIRDGADHVDGDFIGTAGMKVQF